MSIRNLFPGYYRPTDEEFTLLWKECTFIFDTNALLNIYSYPDAAREAFLATLEKIQDRIWIPHQAALEFHRNKFKRIKQSRSDIQSAKNAISGHTSDLIKHIDTIKLYERVIDTDDLKKSINEVENAYNKLVSVVDEIYNKLPDFSLNDPIGARLVATIEDRIGQATTTQSELDKLFSEAEERYKNKTPPGYSDSSSKSDSSFTHKNLLYYNRHGDYILWRQVLNYSAHHKIPKIILITDDEKEDWWWKESGKTIGPRPELAQEAQDEGGVKLFWMYNASEFLRHAKEYLHVDNISDQVIEEAQTTSDRVQISYLRSNTQKNINLQNFYTLFDEFSDKTRLAIEQYRQQCLPGTFYSDRSIQWHQVIDWLHEQFADWDFVSYLDNPNYIISTSQSDASFFCVQQTDDMFVLSNFRRLHSCINRLLAQAQEHFTERTCGGILFVIPKSLADTISNKGWYSDINYKFNRLEQMYNIRFVYGFLHGHKYIPLARIGNWPAWA